MLRLIWFFVIFLVNEIKMTIFVFNEYGTASTRMPLACLKLVDVGVVGRFDGLTLEWMYSEEEINITPIYVLPIRGNGRERF